ncbi:MAG: hypothetical protein CVV16_12630 [Gammaproteobacteria bacterium HGW-Gammaproteobacteria-6]|nr:MAG: hypothetical protein CVV16_12630 [Gammaproteobacteria bacterium HGW-Gammaproteobacteria-6]
MLAAGGAGSEWVIARGRCAYTVLDGSSVPAAKRRAFVSMAVNRWAPFSDPQAHVQWVGDSAMVWAWSQHDASAVLEEGENEPPRRITPESLFVGSALADDAVLVAMDEGFEGRVWRRNLLIASVWWPESPTLAQWNAFLRGAGRRSVDALPALEPSSVADAPWHLLQGASIQDMWGRHRVLALQIGAALVLAALCYPLAGIARLAMAQAAVERKIESQDASLQAILSARDQAERDAQAAQSLLALRPPQSQIALFDHAIAAIPGNGWTIVEWRMPNRDALEVLLNMPRPDPRALVIAWEASGYFAEVTAELGRGADEVIVRARIVRERDASVGAGP